MIPPDNIVHLLEQYGYLFLFLIAIAEGPIITIIGAFLASQGYFNIFAVYAVVVAGDLCGDLLYYCIGRLGRTGALAGLRRSFGMTDADFTRIERYIGQHGAEILLLAKYTQTGFLALPASGAARMPVGKFLWYNALGTIPKSLALLIIGGFFGYAYNRIDGYFAKASLLIFGMSCIAVAYFWLRRYLRMSYGEH
jgi:membrane protein DedA with SNARE-associated domain